MASEKCHIYFYILQNISMDKNKYCMISISHVKFNNKNNSGMEFMPREFLLLELHQDYFRVPETFSLLEEVAWVCSC